jgi:hypothetical protein
MKNKEITNKIYELLEDSNNWNYNGTWLALKVNNNFRINPNGMFITIYLNGNPISLTLLDKIKMGFKAKRVINTIMTNKRLDSEAEIWQKIRDYGNSRNS